MRARQDEGIPELRVRGTALEAGEQLGAAWARALQAEADTRPAGRTPWWRHPLYARLVEQYAPHLPDLYRGMARGAGVPEDRVTTGVPMAGAEQPSSPGGGCTSFAIAPGATLEGRPISGQTKDVSWQRGQQFQVLALEMDDSPHEALTLTYPGWLFGHGFVAGGCALFRNSLFVESPDRGMPYGVWGMLALHCPSVEEVMQLTRDYGVAQSFHVTVADEAGDLVGIEHGRTATDFLGLGQGIYVHANGVVRHPELLAIEADDANFRREDSRGRCQALQGNLEANQGRLSAPLCYAALMDHTGYPVSVCRHQSEAAMTSAAVIAEPVQRRLHVARGPVCQNWPRTHILRDQERS